MDFSFYGTIEEANDYFDMRLHERAWRSATTEDRGRALYSATRTIDALNFKGVKHSVWLLSEPSQDEIRQANADQPLEFPRGSDIEVPDDIRIACYEIAHSLLDGKDPELELEALGITSQAFSSVRTSYNRDKVPIEHLVNLCPSATAWRLLKPFLRDDDAVKLSRIA